MATLVIGAGLVGAQVARILVEGGERPVLMDFAAQPTAIGEIVALDKVELIQGDILRPLSIIEATTKHKITAMVHTAANPLLTLGAQRDPFSAINLNIMGTVNVLEAARVTGIKRVVVSSSNVLNHYIAGGEGEGPELNEEAYPRPTTFYASTKQAMESLGLNYARWCGIEFAAMRYGAVFGPWSGAGGGGPSNVVREALQQAMSGGEAKVPAGTMEWVYSKDAAQGTVAALKAKDLGTGVFNVTIGDLATPEQFAAALKKVVPGAKVKIESPTSAGVSLMDMKKRSDLSRSKRVIGYAPQFRLDAALSDMVAWMKGRG